MDEKQQRRVCKAVIKGRVNALRHVNEKNVDTIFHSYGVSSRTGLPFQTTLAHLVCSLGLYDYLRLLFALGSTQLSIRDSTGRLPIHCAIEAGQQDIVEFLIHNDPDSLKEPVVDEEGRASTLMHLAARSDDPSTIITLHAADETLLFKKDAKGITARQDAILRNKRRASRPLAVLTYEEKLYVNRDISAEVATLKKAVREKRRDLDEPKSSLTLCRRLRQRKD